MAAVPLRFTKMHGLGNDYVFIDLFDQSIDDPTSLARAISDRRLGVGSDGLILVGPPESPDAHVRMTMYNADGSRAEMCGNGIRCVGKLAYERGWAPHNPLRVQSDAAIHTLHLELDRNDRVRRVRVGMGAPILDTPLIPAKCRTDRIVDFPLRVGESELRITCVSMGNPHAVVFVESLDQVLLAEWGPLLERHAMFPQRINAHFVEVLHPDRVRLLSWERGSGATQACGTGACAVCVAGVLTQRTQHDIVALLPGGALEISWDQEASQVWMSGPACEVFDGVWPEAKLTKRGD